MRGPTIAAAVAGTPAPALVTAATPATTAADAVALSASHTVATATVAIATATSLAASSPASPAVAPTFPPALPAGAHARVAHRSLTAGAAVDRGPDIGPPRPPLRVPPLLRAGMARAKDAREAAYNIRPALLPDGGATPRAPFEAVGVRAHQRDGLLAVTRLFQANKLRTIIYPAEPVATPAIRGSAAASAANKL